ncbi:DUF1108 family protein [Staphylococcus aureus]|nr:DUF1108 family protein [Staphylococcus aureus]
MYYEIGDMIRKNIHVNGFDFKLFILKGHMGISIQVKDMSHKEVSNVIENYKTSIWDEELYNECMSFGLPNC